MLRCGSRTGRCRTRRGDCTGVCFLLHGGAGQSAIEPNSIPSEIKQRALPQTRPYDDCVAIFDIVPDGVSGFVEIDIVVVVQQWQNSLLLDGPPLSTEDLKALTNSRSDAGTHTLPS